MTDSLRGNDSHVHRNIMAAHRNIFGLHRKNTSQAAVHHPPLPWSPLGFLAIAGAVLLLVDFMISWFPNSTYMQHSFHGSIYASDEDKQAKRHDSGLFRKQEGTCVENMEEPNRPRNYGSDDLRSWLSAHTVCMQAWTRARSKRD